MGNGALLAIGMIMMLVGIILMGSTLHLQPLSWVSVKTPVASVTIGDISPEDAKRIGIGAIITVLGLALVLKGK